MSAQQFITVQALIAAPFGFDLIATFLKIDPNKSILSTLEDGRKVSVKFVADQTQTTLIQQFEPEMENTLELQQQGWQAILDQFKSYCEQDDDHAPWYWGTINAEVTGLTQKMAYGIPTFQRNSKNFIHYAGYSKHIGLYPGAKGIAAFAAEFEKRGYKYSKGAH